MKKMVLFTIAFAISLLSLPATAEEWPSGEKWVAIFINGLTEPGKTPPSFRVLLSAQETCGLFLNEERFLCLSGWKKIEVSAPLLTSEIEAEFSAKRIRITKEAYCDLIKTDRQGYLYDCDASWTDLLEKKVWTKRKKYY